MGLEFKATCDRGRDHSGPFFSLTARVRQLGSAKTSPVDRLRVVGVFCEHCLRSGVVAFRLADFGIGGKDAASKRESCGNGAGMVRE